MLDSFSLHSGLKINFEKTEVIFLGNGHKSTKETVISLASNRNITAEKAIKISGLGVHFTYDQTLWRNIDFDEILKTLKERLNCWNWRNLTVLGLIQIIPHEAPSREVYNLVEREARVYHTSIPRPAWFSPGYKSIEFGWCPLWRHPK